MKEVFSDIYHTNGWKGDQSVSGKGSDLIQTAAIRKALPQLFADFHVKSVLDIPCGDYFWFRKIEQKAGVDQYIGADIVPELVEYNISTYGNNIWRRFEVLDALSDRLPPADLILCRDMLGHFTNLEALRTIKNFRASGSTWLLATTFPSGEPNQDIETGQWRPINLEALRYGLGPAIMLINENCTEGEGKFADKSLGLWKLNYRPN